MFIRVLDLETSHETPELGGVVEVGYCDLHVTRRDLLGAPTEFEVDLPRSVLTYPGCPIPPETSAIHHLVDEDVCDGAPWRDALKAVVDPRYIGSDMIALAAHSARFEQLWVKDLSLPPWLCTYKMALRVWQEAPGFSNQALRYYRKPAGLFREKAMPAHRAAPDAYVTAHLLREMLEDGARDHSLSIEAAVKISAEPAVEIICRIGDWRGKRWSEVPDDYMEWVLKKDFNEDVKHTCKYWLALRQRLWEKERAEKAARS